MRIRSPYHKKKQRQIYPKKNNIKLMLDAFLYRNRGSTRQEWAKMPLLSEC